MTMLIADSPESAVNVAMSFHSASLLAAQNAPFQQSPAFGAALTHMGRPPLRIYLPILQRELQIMRRNFGPIRVGVVSRGHFGREQFERIRQQSGCKILIHNAELPTRYPGIQFRHPVHNAEISLDRSATELRAGMAQKWRNRLHRALNQGTKIAHTAMPPDPDHWLLRMDQQHQKTAGYRGYPAAFTAAYAAANRGQARLIEAHNGGEVIAAMLFLCHGNVATYHVGWNSDQGRAVSAHQLVLWEAMKQLQNRGITRLDLGLVDTETAPGLARFKLGSGATCKKLGGTWLLKL